MKLEALVAAALERKKLVVRASLRRLLAHGLASYHSSPIASPHEALGARDKVLVRRLVAVRGAAHRRSAPRGRDRRRVARDLLAARAVDREELVAAREAIAREKAGREDPPEDPSTAGRFMRWEAQLGDAFEVAVGAALGPGRARELRASDEGWGMKRLTHTNLCMND